VLLALAAAALWWKVEHMLAAAEQRGYERRAQEDQQRAELQRESNRGWARKAEEKHAAQQAVREEFLVITETEIRREAAPLASCAVPPAAVRLLNDAAHCAREDRPASCGAGDGVRGS
jgi:hypothetical protein